MQNDKGVVAVAQAAGVEPEQVHDYGVAGDGNVTVITTDGRKIGPISLLADQPVGADDAPAARRKGGAK